METSNIKQLADTSLTRLIITKIYSSVSPFQETLKSLKKSENAIASISKYPFTNLVEIYFKATFLICYSPFWISKAPQSERFHIKQNALQMVLCILFGIFGLTYKVNQCMFGRSRFQNYDCPKSLTGLENPVSYLTKLSSLFGWLYRVKTLHQFWTQKNGFLDLVNCLKNAENFPLKVPCW